MVTFMLKGRYSSGGVQGSLAEGFGRRLEYFRQLVALYEGQVIGAYWTEGEEGIDSVAIVEMPDAVAMKAIEIAINQSGSIHVTVVRLYNVEEMDLAREKLPPYRAPGQVPPPLVQ